VLVQEKTVPSVPALLLAPPGLRRAVRCSSLPSPSTRARASVDDKQLVLFVIVPAVYHIARGERAGVVIDVIVSVRRGERRVLESSSTGLLHYDNLGRRPEGAMSHYMTYSGLLMLVICAAAARLIFGRVGTHVAGARHAGARRSAGADTRAERVDRRLGCRRAAPCPQGFPDDSAAAGCYARSLFAIAPGTVDHRVKSIFDVQDPTKPGSPGDGGDRREESSRNHPLTGVCPNMIPRVYAEYRPGTTRAQRRQPAPVHNVPLQIRRRRRSAGAVESGSGFIACSPEHVAQFPCLFRTQSDKVPSAAGLAGPWLECWRRASSNTTSATPNS